MRPLARGLLAGAAGTIALNAVTYGDMLIRGRPASTMPERVADRLARRAGLDPDGDERAPNREQAAGALLGVLTGLGAGAVYGLARARADGPPPALAGPLLGAAVMAGSDVPATALGVTRPGTWSAGAWLSDVVPHMAYGVTTAAVYDATRRA
ncbi:hypothetical protein [Streptomyces litchfieldiae]|uniref:DUF1440 domain-containing protein n=1 Tax=Streptomyces litchfieldiae TaxID=3075543 RepID=A0ABU2MPM1_9ACTN|nr:hypothetical protein [Streptomyces sp. DSM 44938]MDT0343303.1 hypothetical protein [Streptomyces sp. DSM 44938]